MAKAREVRLRGRPVGDVAPTLRRLGLTAYGARAFGAVLELGDATAADVVLRTGIPDSKVYYALEELADRGLVEVQGGKPKRFRLGDPGEAAARLGRALEERHARESAAVRSIAALMEAAVPRGPRGPRADLAFVVKGTGNVVARAQSLVRSAKREVILLCSDAAVLAQLAPSLEAAAGRRVRLRLAVPEAPLPPPVAKVAEVREIVCDCITLVADGAQLLTVSRSASGDLYAIHSTDATLVRFGTEFFDSPRCCAA